MFFVTYLRRELRRRMRQAVVIALGLALGVGLVITVTAASAGVRNAQAAVLRGLYGVGTDLTVTDRPKAPSGSPRRGSITIGPGGTCTNGRCHPGAQQVDTLAGTVPGALAATSVAAIARLRAVAAVAGGLDLTDTQISIPASVAAGQGGPLPEPRTFGVDGVDLTRAALGPLSAGTIAAGRNLARADAGADVAVVDSGYATAHRLKVGSTITIAKAKFAVVGLVTQPQAGSPPAAYIPLARAQALATDPATGQDLKNKVNTIYVTAASAADIPTVQREIAARLPSAQVTTSSSLARQVTGSLASTARLANELGRWLSVLVLIAAFAVASLLTMGAVSRRVREFGTLKALGWRSRRIVAQVLGESLTLGLVGGAAGAALGVAGAALITTLAPKLTATLAAPDGLHFSSVGPGGPQGGTVTPHQTVAVPMHASVTVGVVLLAVLLAVAGSLVAGAVGGWRIGRLRPAAALARVE
jgi:putative ABC transport system permease protein